MSARFFMHLSAPAAGRRLRNRRLGTVLVIMGAALSSGCTAPDKETVPPANTRYLADALVPVSPQRSPIVRKKWIGRGARDVCGNPWSIELTVEGDKVVGEFWLRSIKYDIEGFLDSAGRMDAIPGRKNEFYKHYIGPREMKFSVTFKKGEAIGEHHFSYGRCLTKMRLFPAKIGPR